MTSHPLLADLTDPQSIVVETAAQVWLQHAKWPHYSYVERVLDGAGLALEEVLPTFPAVGAAEPSAAAVSYRAVWHDRLGSGRDRRLGLTVAGLAHAAHGDEYVQAFLHSLAHMARARRQHLPEPFADDEPALSAADFANALNDHNDLWISRLPELFRREPATWGGDAGIQDQAAGLGVALRPQHPPLRRRDEHR